MVDQCRADEQTWRQTGQRLLLAVVFVFTAMHAGCGGPDERESYAALQALHDEVLSAPAPMLDDEADEAVHRCLKHLSPLGVSTTIVDGEELRMQAARATFKVASVMMHRHHDAKRAKTLLAAARDIFSDIGSPAALSQAKVLDRQLKRIAELFPEDHLGRDQPVDGAPDRDSSVVAIQN